MRRVDANAANRRIVLRGLVVVALMAAPVAALIALQAGVFAACASATMAEGVLDGHVAWRVTRMTCRGSEAPYYDVAVGAEHKAMATALVSRGAPVPLEVVRTADGAVAVRLDRARTGTGEALARLNLRRSGSPAERIDLQADQAP